MRLHWLWLAHRPGLSNRMKNLLLTHFADPEDIYYADAKAFDHVEGLTDSVRQALLDKDLRPAEEILTACDRKKIQILTLRDAAYPTGLKNICDPPLVLYYKGQLPDFDAYPVIGVVGTRKASAYGLTTAKRMGYQIARCGAILVSGMAFGIDGMAMSGALTAGGKTVGVLGCGVDVVYPLPNGNLFRDVEDYGCLFSEYPPGTPPLKHHFPRRNRIISGLSNGVLVVEAPEVSGALITARHASEQGRDVFVVPGNIDQPSCVGSNRLLKDGAIVASSGWDVVGEYQGLYPGKVRKETSPVQMKAYPEEVEAVEKSIGKVAQSPRQPEKTPPLKKILDKKGIDNRDTTPYHDLNKGLPKLGSTEQAIVDALKTGERLVDDIIAETGMDAKTVTSALTMLAIKGIVTRLPGNRIKLRNGERE